MMQTQTLEKVREERPPLNAKRPALRRARADLARIIARFLREQAPKIAAQVSELAGLEKARRYIEGEGGEAYAALRQELLQSYNYRGGVFILTREAADEIAARHPELVIERQGGQGFFTLKTPEGFTLGPPARGGVLPTAPGGRGGAAEIEAIIARVDFAGWSVLVGNVEPTIEAVIKDSAYAALAQVGIDTEARKEVRNIVDERAVAYARERGAEMVGMRVDELGRLIPNPNAFWQITEPTRDYIRASVREAIAEGWSNDRLAAALSEAYGFSSTRAMVIARTETNRAASIGALMGYKASGVVDAKKWLTAEDDLVSEECQANGVAGPAGDGVLPLDADYPSGDEAPPVHPNCRCAIAPVVDLKRPTTPTAEQGVPVVPVTVAPPVAPIVPTPPARPVVEFRGGAVSDNFRAMASAFINSMAPSLARKLAKNDIKFAFGDKLTEISPELKGLHPRGYPRGATWDWSNGVFSPNKAEIAVSETYRDGANRPFITKGPIDAKGTLAHETGHGLDHALGKEAGTFYKSRSPEFILAYATDVRALRAAERQAKRTGGKAIAWRYKYFLQKGEAGRVEAFAETYGEITNGARYGLEMRATFPRVAAYIDKLLADLVLEGSP